MKPKNLPENPKPKPPFVFSCPSCGYNDSTTSANVGLIVCRNCKTEFYDGNPTDVAGMKDMLEPKKKTEPFE